MAGRSHPRRVLGPPLGDRRWQTWGVDSRMAVERDDPWSSAGVVPWYQGRAVAVGVVIGGFYGGFWLAVGRPPLHLSQWFLAVGLVGGAIAAALGPPWRRYARLMLGASGGFAAQASFWVVASAAVLWGGSSGSHAQARWAFALSVAWLALMVAASVLSERGHRLERRLPDELLARIPGPPATRMKPRKIVVRCRDGSNHSVTVMTGGFLAFRSGIAASDAVDLAMPPSDPQQVKFDRAMRRRGFGPFRD